MPVSAISLSSGAISLLSSGREAARARLLIPAAALDHRGDARTTHSCGYVPATVSPHVLIRHESSYESAYSFV